MVRPTHTLNLTLLGSVQRTVGVDCRWTVGTGISMDCWDRHFRHFWWTVGTGISWKVFAQLHKIQKCLV